MDTYFSGEDLVIKMRKPYTITKQRERWTEEEHNRFLEALKLYGRSWQRIEEHIGTKTAVQIRSHAQKFFSKLEKEAIAKGVPLGQTLNIDIPPPRPKRKPSNPYPRKMGAGPTASQVGRKDGKLLTSVSFLYGKQVMDLEKEPFPEKSKGNEKPRHAKENQDENFSGVFTLLQETHSSSLSSVNKNSTTKEVLRKSCSFQEFIPSLKGIVNCSAAKESYHIIELEEKEKLDTAEKAVQDNDTMKASKLENSCPLHEKLVQGDKSHDFTMASPTDDLQATQNYPRHVHVHVLDGSLGTSMRTCPSDLTFQDCLLPLDEAHSHPNIYSHPAASNTAEYPINTPPSSMHQPYPTFPPPVNPAPHNQNDYRSCFHISSTFSSLIVSTLLQNPAAHAAASFAATFWPYADMDSSADSPTCSQGVPLSRQINSAPGMAAIAAATVAAATAWWAAHGILPLCAPLNAAFTRTPASETVVPVVDTGKVAEKKQERGETAPDNPLQDQQLEPEHSGALQAQNSTSDSEEIVGPKVNTGSSTAAHENAAAAHETHDSSKTKSRKQVDRSSCGSNTPSSSEVETDALEKHGKGAEEPKEADANHPAAETSSRRSRSGCSMSDSWKEVSEEGRLAFQALFSREILPQSFSPPHDPKCKVYQKENTESDREAANVKIGDVSLTDLNSKTRPSCSCHPEMEGNALHKFESNVEFGLLTIGLGNGKLKAPRTGFKPYKRCSVEAMESKMVTSSSQGEGNVPKRIRLEGEAST